MKKFFSLLLLISGILILLKSESGGTSGGEVEGEKTGGVVYQFALVADSHLDNTGLISALEKAKNIGVDRVFGLGDWTNYGEVEKLREVKGVFDRSGLKYEVLSGDHDLANSRDLGLDSKNNFNSVFGEAEARIVDGEVEFILVDNADIYRGISDEDWFEVKNYLLTAPKKLRFVLAHKAPYNPDTSHIMGSENWEVALQARSFLYQLENSRVSELFTGDLHHFARYQSPNNGVKITTVGAITTDKNFQGPSFAVVKVFSNYTYEVENIQL